MPASLYPLTVPLPPSSVALPVPQVIDTLRYRVYDRPVDLAPLVVRQVRRFAWGQAQVSAYVLGASHALTLDLRKGRTVTELLTCLPPRETSNAASVGASEWRVPTSVGEPWGTTFAHGEICGVVTLSRFALADTSDELCSVFGRDDTLQEPFPTRTGETAWTRVGWRLDGPRLFVETIHTYPEEGEGIRSVTRFSLPETTLTDGPNS